MALSKQDIDFYEEKLNWRTFGYIFAFTCVLGAIVWPAALYCLDASADQTAAWNFNVAFNDSVMGFMIGSIVTIALYIIFKFFLAMGWMPKRR